MKFVIAPDKYKGSLTGFEFCNAVEEGIRLVFPDAEILKKPLADGGDGTLEVVKNYLQAKTFNTTVHDPLCRQIKAPFLYSEKKETAFIEMAKASGHHLLRPEELNCMETTTLGTGELIRKAIEKGATQILLGIGGSATNDGGMGVAHALGYSFLDKSGQVLDPIGKNLIKVATIKKPKDQLFHQVRFKVACDVNNVFYGSNGAAQVYAAQKGASEEQIKQLDKGLRQFAAIIQKEFDVDLQSIEGAGAAGGLGGAIVAFFNGQLISGINLIKDLADFDHSLHNTDWIITGEGKLDDQTLQGKTIAGVLQSAKKHNVKVAAFCGVVELSIETQMTSKLTFATSIMRNFQNLEEAINSSYENLKLTTFNFCRSLSS